MQAQTLDALRGGQEGQEGGSEARCVSEASQPSHSLPAGRFEALPRIVQIAGVGERLVALTINGELWARRFGEQGHWRLLPSPPMAR